MSSLTEKIRQPNLVENDQLSGAFQFYKLADGLTPLKGTETESLKDDQ